MKRLSKTARHQQIRLSQSRERRRLKRKYRHVRYVGGHPILSGHVNIVMPSRLGIFRPEAHEALTETIQAIQRSLKNRNTKVFLDFRLTEHASVAGLLLLHSSIRAAEAENNCQLKKTLIPPKNARVRMIMNRVGFLKPDNYLESQPGFIPLTTDVKGSTFAKKLFANMNTAIYDNKLQKGGPEWDRLQSAIGEAILNVFEHAYDDAKTKPITDRMGYRK
jgi:hypothetical protein